MPTLSRKTPLWLPVVVLIIAMTSIQSGASLAKSLFPLVGAPGVTALRLALGTLILAVVFKPWQLRFTRSQRMPLLVYGLALGAMNYLFYLSIRTVPLGIAVALEFTGPLAVALFGSRRPVDFLWVILAVLGLWFLLPLGQDVTHVDPFGAACALGAGVCWAVYIIAGQKAGAEHGPATVALGSLIAAIVFVPIGAIAARRALALVCAAARPWHRRAFHRAALFAGDDRAHAPAHANIRHANEYGACACRLFRHAVSWRNADARAVAGIAVDYHRLHRLDADAQT